MKSVEAGPVCGGCQKIVTTFLNLLKRKSETLYIHSLRTADIAQAISVTLGYKGEDARDIYTAALMHDVGKIHTPKDILLKDSNLSDDEFRIIQSHPQDGAELLKPFLKRVPTYILYHHESYNGTGYPEGLKNSHIPIQSKIIAIADRFAALTSRRTYRNAYQPADALLMLKNDIHGFFDGRSDVVTKVLKSQG